MKVLVIRFGAMGDLVHVSPSLQALKAQYPEAEIHLLTSPLYVPLTQQFETLDKVWGYDKKTGLKGLWQLAQQLKPEKYTHLINLHPSFRTFFLSALLGPKLVEVYRKEKIKPLGQETRHQNRLHAIENFFRPFQACFNLQTLGNTLLPTLLLSDSSAHEGRTPKRIALIPGVGQKRSNRAWPIPYYQALITRLLENPALEILLIGGPEEAEWAEKLCLGPQVQNHCGKHSILETASLLASCQLVIGGDTGPLHLASALGVPVLGLFGPTSVNRTGPRGKGPLQTFVPQERLACWPCELAECPLPGKQKDACMNDIAVLQVYQACQEQLGLAPLQPRQPFTT